MYAMVVMLAVVGLDMVLSGDTKHIQNVPPGGSIQGQESSI